MTKTYEANWHNPETGIDILVARGSKDYVTKCAQMSQFVPFTIREYQTPENIWTDYREWRKENQNRKPNRVIVKMHWEDDENTEKDYQIDTIGIIPQSKIGNTETIKDDCWILFYTTGLKGLLELMKPNNGSDFVVDEVLEFYKK